MLLAKQIHLNVILIVIIIIVVGFCNTKENSPCKTPYGLHGTCIKIKKCQHIVNVLYSLRNIPDNAEYIRQSECGRSKDDSTPLVCCVSSPRSQRSLPVCKQQIIAENYALPSTDICGVHFFQAVNYVAGGHNAEQNEFPWIVALGYRNKANDRTDFLCSGTIITKRHILTAAHCVHRRQDLCLVRYGVLNLHTDPKPIDVAIEDKRPHPEYDETRIVNDIAILKVAQEIEFLDEPLVRPICLPDNPSLRSQRYEGKNSTIAGWGSLYFRGPTSDRLQTLQLPIVTNEQCKTALSKFKTTVIDNRVICASFPEGGKDACQGDSGGPLMHQEMIDNTVNYYQIGVISYGYRCAEPGYPGVYTRVTEFIDWIKSQLY